MQTPGPRRRSSIAGKVGARVRALREQQGMSQVELARRARTGRAALRLIEAGRRDPSLTTVDAIAESLGVPVSAFFTTATIRASSKRSRVVRRLTRSLEGRPESQLEAVEAVLDALLQALDTDRRSARAKTD